MNTDHLLTAVITLAGVVTALSSVVAHLHKQQQKLSREAIQWREQVITNLTAKVDKLEARESIMEQRIADLEQENARLKMQWQIYSSSHDSSPLPQWIKDRNGIVLAANKAYEQLFLAPLGFKLADYVGFYDTDIWPEHIAAQFMQNDNWVLNSEKTFDGMELIRMPDDTDRPVRVIKYARYVTGISQPFGVAGIAVPESLTW